MNILNICLIVLLTSISTSRAKEGKLNILALFLHPGKSHFDVFAPLVEELAQRGHNITVISHFPRKDNDLPTYRDISLVQPTGVFLDVIDVNLVPITWYTVFFELAMLSQWGLKACKDALQEPDVQALIDSDVQFDLILTELFNSDCSLGIVHKFRTPFIALSSHQIVPWGNPRFNNPDNPSYIPGVFHGYPANMSFLERVKNTVLLEVEKILFEVTFTRPTQNIIDEYFGPGVPALSAIAENTSAFLVNTHYSLHGSRPYLPNIVEIGGLHIRGNKPLPKDIKDFLDEATDGVLFFSWGSMVKTATLPEEKLKAIVRVMGSIPQRVIWKWEVNDLPGKPKNVMVKKWLPQFDIISMYLFFFNLFQLDV